MALAQDKREIATELVLSEKTVERHLSHNFTKLQVSSRAAAVRLAAQAGIASSASPSRQRSFWALWPYCYS